MRHITILADQLENHWSSAPKESRPASLRRFLARAAHSEEIKRPVRQVLMSRFGLKPDQGAAPFNMLADGLEPGSNFCIHADPVCLYVDMARIFITRWGAAGLAAGDQAVLASGLAEHFTAEGMALHTPTPERWYLTGPVCNAADFPAPDSALGRDIGEILPAGPEAVFWKSRLNESQMILNRNPVNERLAGAGQPAINSLWFWGGGTLPDTPGESPRLAVCGSDHLLLGLAQWADVPVAAGPGDLLAVDDYVEGLVVMTAASFADGDYLPQLAHSLEPLISALMGGNLESISLRANGHVFVLRRADWYAFWRRRVPRQFSDTPQ